MNLNLIWAQTREGVIGNSGALPWDDLPEDMSHFRQLTSGHPVIMGSKTWESLPEQYRPLPRRRNIVLSRNTTYHPGAETHTSLDDALGSLPDDETAWVIGGGEIYRAALPHATELHVTEVDIDVAGDTHAPALDGGVWHIDPTRSDKWTTSCTGLAYRFLTYTRMPWVTIDLNDPNRDGLTLALRNEYPKAMPGARLGVYEPESQQATTAVIAKVSQDLLYLRVDWHDLRAY